MPSVFEIPLSPFAESFQIEINSATYYMRTHWNGALQRWTLDIGRSADNWIICNIALVAGQNLLMQHDHMKLGFELWVQVDGQPEEDVGIEGFGEESALLVIVR